MNNESIQIGWRDEWGQQIPFGISLPDLRQHVYVIGKAGSGKTTLLRNMVSQHIYLGHGLPSLSRTATCPPRKSPPRQETSANAGRRWNPKKSATWLNLTPTRL